MTGQFGSSDEHRSRADALFRDEYDSVTKRTDRMLAALMVAQWAAAIVFAHFFSPYTWAGKVRVVHAHVFAAVVLGGVITSLPVFLAILQPGRQSTRYALACGQALWTALLIHLTGGRIETHFHIFGSLAFLAFYRDLKVLIPATVIVAADHFVRGMYWPESVYGVANPEWWRFLEHAGWVLFIDVFLIKNCQTSRNDLKRLCERQARLEHSESIVRAASADLERRVEERTAQLSEAVENLETAKTRIEAQQRETFEFMENIPLGVYVMTSDGKPCFANKKSTEILGQEITSDTKLGNLTKHYRAFVRGTDEPYPEEKMPIVRALTGEQSSIDDCEIETPNGRVILSVQAAPIFGSDGKVKYGLSVFDDITARVHAENDRLQGQKLESVGQLAAGVAHEINTPMQYIGDNAHFLQTAMTNVLEMLKFHDQLLGEDLDKTTARSEAESKAKLLKIDFLRRKIPRCITSTIEGVESVSTLVRAMKEFSHPGGAKKTPTDINRAIETTVTISKNEWKYVADLETQLDPSLPLVPCLPGELNQVILNMIVNSAHAISDMMDEEPKKGLIRLSTRLQEAWAEIELTDTGAGIPESVRQKIFDPFFTTKEIGKGTGQGLAIARSIIVDKHGGSIDVASCVGRGTTFTIRLPIETAAESDQFEGAA